MTDTSPNESATPAAQEPADQAPSDGPPGGPPAAGTPVGDRRRGRLVAIAVVVSVAVVGAIGTVVALNVLGDDGSETVEGDGYSYEVPEGWHDATEWTASEAPETGDTGVMADQADDGFGTNVLVLKQDADGATTAEEARELWPVPVGAESDFETVEDITIDGERAAGMRWTLRNGEDRLVVQRGYFAVSGGTSFAVVLSTTPDSERESTETMHELIASWSWR
jgi:hypothetical protein